RFCRVTAGKALTGPFFLWEERARHSRLTASAGVRWDVSYLLNEMPASPSAPHPHPARGPPRSRAGSSSPLPPPRCTGSPRTAEGARLPGRPQPWLLDEPALQALFPLDAIPNPLQLRGARVSGLNQERPPEKAP
ncbi:hypothetical protein QTO34_009091, partial [Cnephaeus nilssonii]